MNYTIDKNHELNYRQESWIILQTRIMNYTIDKHHEFNYRQESWIIL